MLIVIIVSELNCTVFPVSCTGSLKEKDSAGA